VRIRVKTPLDMPQCVDLLLRVHAADGYPLPLPRDVPEWITPQREVASWVADRQGEVLGHVALHTAAPGPLVTAAEQATGLPAQHMAVLSRLFTTPEERRNGLGRALLRHAMAEAERLKLRLILDVGRNQTAPIALYESEGWQRLGSLDVPVANDIVLVLWLYLSPPSGGSSV
jgi:GNAT superfamily N-acetyltransferase